MDLRAIVEARRSAFGLTRAALAQRMAPRWAALAPDRGCSPESAEKALRRWINREQRGDMTSNRLAELLDELGFAVTVTDSGKVTK